jgi:pimeloyl-ACP methyl ester carboxylesterase
VAKLGLGTRVNIVGHDLGGMVAYAYAAQNPDEVRSLVILDVPLQGVEPVATDVRAVEIRDSGHWVAEEQPDAVASALIEFLPPPE